MHSIKGGMTNCQAEMKKAVDCGYWNLFRYNPEGAEARSSRSTPRRPPAATRSSS